MKKYGKSHGIIADFETTSFETAWYLTGLEKFLLDMMMEAEYIDPLLNKYCLYESSVRVPLIVSGTHLPKNLKGVRDSHPAELVDIYPTIMSFAGVSNPQELPGKDLFSSDKRKASFCALHETEGEASFMWRNLNHKLILVFKRKANPSEYTNEDIIGGEFYDLENDPDEWTDLYGTENLKVIRTRMTNELMQHLSDLEKI